MSFWDEPPGSQRVRMVFRDDDSDGQFSDTMTSGPVGGCSIQPREPSESYNTGQQYTIRYAVFGPPELSALRAQDALMLEMVPGSDAWVRATLLGPPQVWAESPHNVQITVQQTAG